MFTLSFCDGKYGIVNNNGIMTAFRNGEPWDVKTESLIGDKFTLCLVQHIEDLEDEIERLKRK